ncbi:MAG: hypothetical protein NT085_02460 [candidate division SR1 bacterium]|nr:hypothetical protein [candidate division SR1 bacterium]
MKINEIVLDPTQLIKNQLVVVKTSENCFEIGKVSEVKLQAMGPTQRTILMLTEASFPTNPPFFDKNWTPFLINPDEEIPLEKYPLYEIDILYVSELLNQQKSYLEMDPERIKELNVFLLIKAILLDDQKALQQM